MVLFSVHGSRLLVHGNIYRRHLNLREDFVMSWTLRCLSRSANCIEY